MSTLRGASDYDNSTSPADGQVIGWWAGGSRWQPQTVVSQYQRGVIGGVFDAGAVASPWAPNASTANDQTATTAAALTVGVPTQGTNGQRLMLLIGATGASQVITIDSGLGMLAGYPRTLQVPVGKVCHVLMRYHGGVGRWIVLTFSAEG